ncbi:MAG TPA: cobalamin-independent methionine synthase II family protein [Xanthobacteraceae bacterium]|nr:cobalamin-independent methionine synthase II family protein [Xanthobacteraceae bacterium]
MKRSEKRILTTHVGSLVRPKALLEAGKNDPRHGPAYQLELKRAVAEVVAQQAKAGIDIVNDGEFGKSGWANYSLERLTGFEARPDKVFEAVWLGRDRIRFAEFMAAEFPRGAKGSTGHACVGPIKYDGHAEVRRDLENLKAAAAAADKTEELFFTAVAPASVGYDAQNEYYETEQDYVFAIADALREEYLEIYGAGVVLQVDDAVLANMFDHLTQQSPKRYREWAELRVAALNRALEGIPEDRIRYHICFGSWHVPHVADAQLEDVIDLMLKVKAGAYSIEAANVRHEHEWHVWEKVKLPAGRILIPGVITHHTVTVEHPKLVAERIVNFARAVGRENVIAGTDCGFAQTEGIQRVHPQVMWAKFDALVEGARLASKQLWA